MPQVAFELSGEITAALGRYLAENGGRRAGVSSVVESALRALLLNESRLGITWAIAATLSKEELEDRIHRANLERRRD